jgi:hypothetical protein
MHITDLTKELNWMASGNNEADIVVVLGSPDEINTHLQDELCLDTDPA